MEIKAADLPESKKCLLCGLVKLLAEFYSQPRGLYGKHSRCKSCMSELHRKYREVKGDELAAQKREWREKNKEEISARVRAARNPEKEKARKRAYRARDIEHVRRLDRESAARRADRLEFKLNNRVRAQIHRVLRKSKSRISTVDLLGYTMEELKDHLERQFEEGMTWENMGDWHIDHIIPLSLFKFSGPECPEIRKAWALYNLRPMWSSENMSKGAKRIYLI